MSARRTSVALACLVLGAGSAGRAQISPGPLSRPHAKLEGSGHCLSCHEARRGVSPDKCLACHQVLQKRVAAGKGLHARPEYRDCKTCHVEHQGVEAELVWWGKQGRQAFEHALTGYPLLGKHATLTCAQCHKQKSYLGAAVDCAGCHRDVHRGEFAGRSCVVCHTQTAWKPASGFDHATTRFPLSGKHVTVACNACHRPSSTAAAPGAPAEALPVVDRDFRVVAGQECASCHQDVHRGRLGNACANCHSTASWRQVRTAGFDHDRTAYPLRGRHATVACTACHRPGRPMRVAHARCTDCHQDVHRGELLRGREAEAGHCERCHDVQGFRPARFGPEEHAKTEYPLLGAHLAVSCDACHRRAGKQAAPLRLTARRCSECHSDPHRGELTRFAAKGCESCHRVEGWRQASFDHARTRFALQGAHARLNCAQCHRETHPGGARRFAGLQLACGSCHRDVHERQFAAGGRETACERCHDSQGWKPARFDHGRDSRFRLDGAHARLACAQCHRTETRDGRAFVRYKPLPTSCSGCHARKPANGGRP